MTYKDPIERDIEQLPLNTPSSQCDERVFGMLLGETHHARPVGVFQSTFGRALYMAMGVAAGVLLTVMVLGSNTAEETFVEQPSIVSTKQVEPKKLMKKYDIADLSDEGFYDVQEDETIGIISPDGSMTELTGPARFRVDRLGDDFNLSVSKGLVQVNLAEDALTEIRMSFQEPSHEPIPFATYFSIINSSQPRDHKEVQRITAAKNHAYLGDF